MVLDKSQSQHQKIDQNIDVFEDKHGKPARISCSFYTDEIVQSAERFLGCGGVEAARKHSESMKELKRVDVLIFDGKVMRVFCHYLDSSNQQCLNDKNSRENRRCHILEAV